jgi:LPS-assembly lipoprotein
MRTLLALLLSLSLAGCGFHLRGMGGLEFSLDAIHVSATNAYGEMQRELETVLEQSGAMLLPDRVDAPWAVRIVTERTTRRAVSTTSQISVSEYELRLEVTFQLSDTNDIVIPATPVFAERIYSFDSTSLVGSREEEELLTEEMRRDVAAQIVRRIDATVRGKQGEAG